MDPSRLPAEIWDAIFSERTNTPVCLSQICSHLRTTVHANSKLWSDIRINVYKRGIWGGLTTPDNSTYIARVQARKNAHFLRVSGTHPITVFFIGSGLMSTEYREEAFELAEQSDVLPLMRRALGRCREFKIGALAGVTFNDAISELLHGIALPMLQDVSFYGSGWWDGSHALQLLLSGARDIRRIYFDASVFDIPVAHLEWAQTIHKFRLGHCWPTLPGHSISDRFPNISNLSIVAGTTFDRRQQDHVGLRNVLSGLRRLTSLSLYMNYVSQKYALEAVKLADVEIPTLEELSIVYMETAVQYPVDESGFVRLIRRASLKTLRLLCVPLRTVGLLNLLQPVQPTLRVLILSEPLATITPYCPLSPAFLAQMQDKAFLPMLTSLHLVWNHVVDEKAFVDMLEHRAFGEVSVGRGLPFEGMEEEAKRRVLRLNVAYPPLLTDP